VVTGTISALNVFLSRTPVQTHAAAPGAKPARFIDRLPFKLRGAAIRAVSSEDHYLRVHTDRGSDLILMRLSDALTELEGLEGAQTHRSWWVAKDAVLDVSRGDAGRPDAGRRRRGPVSGAMPGPSAPLVLTFGLARYAREVSPAQTRGSRPAEIRRRAVATGRRHAGGVEGVQFDAFAG
jgi:hypothetical protein